MPITFPCPATGKRLTAKDALAGARIRCPACRGRHTVPAPTGPPDATSAPPPPSPSVRWAESLGAVLGAVVILGVVGGLYHWVPRVGQTVVFTLGAGVFGMCVLGMPGQLLDLLVGYADGGPCTAVLGWLGGVLGAGAGLVAGIRGDEVSRELVGFGFASVGAVGGWVGYAVARPAKATPAPPAPGQ